MKLNSLEKSPETKVRKRVGRGPGSGMGKTSTRGHKGQWARSGGGVKADRLVYPEALRLRCQTDLREAAVCIDAQRVEAFAVLLLSHPARAAFSAVHIGVQRNMVARLH